jgi:hypothetical protein
MGSNGKSKVYTGSDKTFQGRQNKIKKELMDSGDGSAIALYILVAALFAFAFLGWCRIWRDPTYKTVPCWVTEISHPSNIYGHWETKLCAENYTTSAGELVKGPCVVTKDYCFSLISNEQQIQLWDIVICLENSEKTIVSANSKFVSVTSGFLSIFLLSFVSTIFVFANWFRLTRICNENMKKLFVTNIGTLTLKTLRPIIEYE